MTVTVFGQYYTVFRTVDSSALFVVTVVLYYVYDSGSHWYLLLQYEVQRVLKYVLFRSQIFIKHSG